MLIASLTVLFLLFGGGGSLEHYLLNVEKPVKAAVENKTTVKEITALSKQLGKELKGQNKELRQLQSQFLDLHQSYDIEAADFEELVDEMIAAREAGQDMILDTRSAMKDLMTQEEWTDVFRPGD